MTKQNGHFADFDYTLRQGLEPPMESSGQDKKSGKHRNSFFYYSKATKAMAAILNWG